MKFDKQDDDNDYKYLVKMPMDSVNKENVEKLLKERDNKQIELNTLKAKTLQTIYYEELDELKNKYLEIFKSEKTKSITNKSQDIKLKDNKLINKKKMKITE